MTRLNCSISTIAIVGVGLSLGAFCGTAGLLQMTGADRLVDGRYDQAIATANAADGGASPYASLEPGLLQLTAGAPATAIPVAATEHVWLTRPVHAEPTQAARGSVQAAHIVGSTIGARFTVAHAGVAQTLEVVEVREINLAEHANSAAGGQDKLLLVSCKVLSDGKSPAAGSAGMVRFIVDADPNGSNPAAVRLPRLL